MTVHDPLGPLPEEPEIPIPRPVGPPEPVTPLLPDPDPNPDPGRQPEPEPV
jgi:hypothetical protein